MVGPNGLEPSTSSVSRMRSNQSELRAYTLRFSFYRAAGTRATSVGAGLVRYMQSAAQELRN